jgi:hypothetical protein
MSHVIVLILTPKVSYGTKCRTCTVGLHGARFTEVARFLPPQIFFLRRGHRVGIMGQRDRWELHERAHFGTSASYRQTGKQTCALRALTYIVDAHNRRDSDNNAYTAASSAEAGRLSSSAVRLMLHTGHTPCRHLFDHRETRYH